MGKLVVPAKQEEQIKIRGNILLELAAKNKVYKKEGTNRKYKARDVELRDSDK